MVREGKAEHEPERDPGDAEQHPAEASHQRCLAGPVRRQPRARRAGPLDRPMAQLLQLGGEDADVLDQRLVLLPQVRDHGAEVELQHEDHEDRDEEQERRRIVDADQVRQPFDAGMNTAERHEHDSEG